MNVHWCSRDGTRRTFLIMSKAFGPSACLSLSLHRAKVGSQQGVGLGSRLPGHGAHGWSRRDLALKVFLIFEVTTSGSSLTAVRGMSRTSSVGQGIPRGRRPQSELEGSRAGRVVRPTRIQLKASKDPIHLFHNNTMDQHYAYRLKSNQRGEKGPAPLFRGSRRRLQTSGERQRPGHHPLVSFLACCYSSRLLVFIEKGDVAWRMRGRVLAGREEDDSVEGDRVSKGLWLKAQHRPFCSVQSLNSNPGGGKCASLQAKRGRRWSIPGRLRPTDQERVNIRLWRAFLGWATHQNSTPCQHQPRSARGLPRSLLYTASSALC